MTPLQENKQRAAIDLWPLYNLWHVECVKQYDSVETRRAQYGLMSITASYKALGVPQKIEASVGRWIARTLPDHVWTTKHGVILRNKNPR